MKIQSLADRELIERIYERIKWDIRVNASDIRISACNGRVILAGCFDRAYRHEAALEIIHSTRGAIELEDHSLVVVDYFRSDADLKALIVKQIKSLELLPGEWINVAVISGVVKLEGEVFRPRLKAFAASDSWGLSGIQDCINLIEVKTPPAKAGVRSWPLADEAQDFGEGGAHACA